MSQMITAAQIKELRDRTGVGMGKCKEALEEAKGDIELAITNLRKAGMASAVKKEGRATNEGMIGFAASPSAVAIVEVNAETDFVVRNDRFKEFVDHIAHEAMATLAGSLQSFLEQKYSKEPSLTIDQLRAVVIQAIGENIVLRRLVSFKKEPNKSYGLYSHLGGKMLTFVEITGSDQEEALAKEIAMHIAAAAPEYLSAANVPQDVIAKEKEIAKSQMTGKPEAMIEKILEGKVKAFFDAVCLENQKYIKDDSLTITDLVNKRAKEVGKNLKVTNFLRWSVGQ